MDENWPAEEIKPMKILEWPNELLTTPCPHYEFKTFTEDLRNAILLGELMERTEKCAGLAANQVGILRRFFVTKGRRGKVNYFFNPAIIKKRMGLVWGKEGCLSFPGKTTDVPRWKTIEVEFWDEKCNHVKVQYRDYEARVFQHELDHLNGLLIFK